MFFSVVRVFDDWNRIVVYLMLLETLTLLNESVKSSQRSSKRGIKMYLMR